jgi:uncharacterized OsmC-like protein
VAEQLPWRPDLLPNHPAEHPDGMRALPCSGVKPQNVSLRNQKELNMSLHDVEVGVKRVVAAFQRRPEVAIHADSPAVSRWDSGTRVVTRSGEALSVVTDMPKELGGAGDQVTPGWLLRAGFASCAATSITLAAASEGIKLTALEVYVGSRSDARGLLGMSEPNGEPVYAGMFDVELRVTIAADGSNPLALESLVTKCLSHSPVPCTLTTATPFALHVAVTSA